MQKKPQRAFPKRYAALIACLAATLALADGRVVRITVTQARSAPVEETEWAFGVIESRFAPQVAAEVAGKVVRVSADEGESVSAGQVLAEIEPRQYRLSQDADQAEVGRLTALVRNKQLDVDRTHKLVEAKLIAAEKVDSVESELDALKRQLEGAQARVGESERRLGKTRVLAPAKSQVVQRHVQVGDFVQTGTVAFDLTDVEHLRVRLPFPEYRAPQLRRGLKVRLTSSAAGSAAIAADISELRPSVNPANRSLTVIVDFSNPGAWRPGASVRAEVVLATRPNAVVVPQVSVVRRPAGDVVYVINNRKAEERLVHRGQRAGANVEIVDGLKAGEVVAVDGAGFLTGGGTVDIAGN